MTAWRTAAAGSSDSVRAYFESDDYLAGNVLIPIRAELVARLLPQVRDARILDLGCGDGSVSRPLLAAGNRLTLVDFSQAMVERARRLTPEGAAVEFIQSDIQALAVPWEYDVVLCTGVLAHVRDVAGTLDRVAEALRPGGTAVVQITDDSSPMGRLLKRYYTVRSGHAYRLNRTSLPELIDLAAVRGLASLEVHRYGLLVPGMGRLPADLERRIEQAVAHRPRLARLAAELLISFRKK